MPVSDFDALVNDTFSLFLMKQFGRTTRKVFKRYPQMKLGALEKINRRANVAKGFDTAKVQ